MSIKINFICDIEDVTKDFLKNIKNKKLLNIYFGDNFNGNINDCVYKNINEKIINKLVECIGVAQYYLNRELSKENLLIENYEWKICIGKEDFMFELPFTLGDVIFMPLNYIIDSVPILLSKTLFHEYVHVSQRMMPDKWDDYILKNSKKKYSLNWKKMDKINHENISENIINNPDTYYHDVYILEKDGFKYKGYLVLDKNNKFSAKWYKIVGDEFIPVDNLIYKYEHPYEMLAYLMSNCVDKKDI